MDVAGVLLDLYGRIPHLVHASVEGMTAEQLQWRPGSGANPIGWLVWHVGRVEDAQIADLVGAGQVWTGGDWARRVGLEPDPRNSGYGHSAEQVAAVRPDGPEVLVGYFDAVHARTVEFLERLGPPELDRVVDRNWDPPVTLGVRLVSIADDCLQHLGQAAYVRGLLGA